MWGQTYQITDSGTTSSSTSGRSNGGTDHCAQLDGGEQAPTDGSPVHISPGATVYMGEQDLTVTGGLQSPLTGVSGNAEGTILSDPIPRDQAEGHYTNDGSPGSDSVTVDTPRADILGGSASARTKTGPNPRKEG